MLPFAESENDQRIYLGTLPDNISACSSKDLGHITRLTGVMHVLTHTMAEYLRGKTPSEIPTEVDIDSLRMAHEIYLVMLKQKNIILQACIHRLV